MYHDKGEASEGWITDIDDYVDDANYFPITLLHLHLSIINIEDNESHLIDFPKNYLFGFISNLFILF